VNAEAFFTLNNGSITITLTNLGANPTADSQEISAISFRVSGSTGSASFATNGATGPTASIASNGSYSPSASTTDISPHWAAGGGASGGTVTLSTVPGTGAQPFDLIIGPDNLGKTDGSGKYTGSGIASIVNHNPSVIGTATFTISIAGVTSSSTLSNVVFQFGTTAGSNLVDGQVTPEPSTAILPALAGVVGLATYVRRRRAGRAA
jgi:hypothetical protein